MAKCRKNRIWNGCGSDVANQGRSLFLRLQFCTRRMSEAPGICAFWGHIASVARFWEGQWLFSNFAAKAPEGMSGKDVLFPVTILQQELAKCFVKSFFSPVLCWFLALVRPRLSRPGSFPLPATACGRPWNFWTTTNSPRASPLTCFAKWKRSFPVSSSTSRTLPGTASLPALQLESTRLCPLP